MTNWKHDNIEFLSRTVWGKGRYAMNLRLDSTVQHCGDLYCHVDQHLYAAVESPFAAQIPAAICQELVRYANRYGE